MPDNVHAAELLLQVLNPDSFPIIINGERNPMKIRALAIFLFVTEGILPAQHLDFGFGFGVKGGIPFTDLLKSNLGPSAALTQNSNYLIGPAAEIRFPFGFAFEADGIYRGTSYTIANGPGGITAINSASWEVPYLGKFRFPIPLLKPFVVAGGAYRTFNNLPPGVTATHNAFVAGGGLELRISVVRFSAEARYLRWGSPPSTDLARLAQSQGEILFGMMFQRPGK